MQHVEEVYEKNLRPSFKSRNMNVGIFAYIARKRWTSLIFVRKRSKKEHTSAHNRLDLNAFQFAKKIHQPHIIPSFIVCVLFLVTSILQEMEQSHIKVLRTKNFLRIVAMCCTHGYPTHQILIHLRLYRYYQNDNLKSVFQKRNIIYIVQVNCIL